MLQLNKSEAEALRSHCVTSTDARGGRCYAPYVFTEQGVAMLSGVLRSERAIAVNIEIMRPFVELRRASSSNATLEKRLEEFARDTGARLGRHDDQLGQIFRVLRLISPPAGKSAGSDLARPRRKNSRIIDSAFVVLLEVGRRRGNLGPVRDRDAGEQRRGAIDHDGVSAVTATSVP